MTIGRPRYVRPTSAPIEGDLLVFNGSTWETISPATSGHVLTSAGAGAAPAFAAVPSLPSDAGLVSLATADAAAGLPYVSAANTWTSRTGSAGDIPYFTSASALGVIASSANGRSLIAAANYAAMLSALGGQASDATLTAWAGAGAQGLAYFSAVDTVSTLTLAADKGIYASGVGTLNTYDLSSFGRVLAGKANANAALSFVADDVLVHATVTCASPAAGVDTATLSVQLRRIDGSTALGSARAFKLCAGAVQYLAPHTPNASLSYSAVTAGSITPTASGGDLMIVTDATGLFSCTVTNTDHETVYWSAFSADAGLPTVATGCVVVSSNSVTTTWTP